jgi:hypothetical protein
MIGLGAAEAQPVPTLFGLIFAAIAGVAILIGWGLGICEILTGHYLTARKNYTFCIVVAGISCAFFPFGTVLGVLTIIVLSKPEVKEMFEENNYGGGAYEQQQQ